MEIHATRHGQGCMSHPALARLKAYACYEVDVDLDVERHLSECVACTDFVVVEMLRLPLTAENRLRIGQLALQGSIARNKASDL
jgi:hypothetical protein